MCQPVGGDDGAVVAMCYESDQHLPDLPVAVSVKWDSYSGPTLPDNAFLISQHEAMLMYAAAPEIVLDCNHS